MLLLQGLEFSVKLNKYYVIHKTATSDTVNIIQCIYTGIGEGPMFMPKSERFAKDKAEMLNTYREMNKAIAESYGCPYIDMRQAFLDAIPSYRLNYKVNINDTLSKWTDYV